MSGFDYRKQTQDYYSKAPLIILGSGASAAHGISGMKALATHLIGHVAFAQLPKKDKEDWQTFCNELKRGVDLESALQQVSISEELTARIIEATWTLINSEDIQIFHRSLQEKGMFPLSRLLRHMFRSSLSKINIVTTNYDRLAEYACDQEQLHHYTGFTHGFYRQLASPTDITSQRRVNIWKVHGSLDWFQSPLRDTVALSNIHEIPNNHEPQIITPGSRKYQKTHLEPYRSIISSADQAITAANSYLCIGYGFNDEHIQPKLMSKCTRQDAPITIITHSLSQNAKNFIRGNEVQNYIAIERGATDDQSIVYSSQNKTLLTVEKNIWSLRGYLSLIM